MRRWCSFLLVVLLSFQFSWATAAGYCQHETRKLASHFGHHEHEHEGATSEAADTDNGEAAGTLGALDEDCAMCHLGCVPPIAASQVAQVVSPIQARAPTRVSAFESHICGVPKRPDRFLAV